jgi:hypothetical protein
VTNHDGVFANKDLVYQQPRDFLLFGYVECIGAGVELGAKVRQRLRQT